MIFTFRKAREIYRSLVVFYGPASSSLGGLKAEDLGEMAGNIKEERIPVSTSHVNYQ